VFLRIFCRRRRKPAKNIDGGGGGAVPKSPTYRGKGLKNGGFAVFCKKKINYFLI
jgi:hypothetical protein